MEGVIDPGGLEERIAAVRRFNRLYTRTLGLLEDGLLRSRFSLAEARVLYELAHRSTSTATNLSRSLDLDAGYLSRILRRFESEGLLARRAGPDRRQSLLSLTEAGVAAFAPLDRDSRSQVADMLRRLPDAAQTAMVEAMGKLEYMLANGQDPGAVRLRAHRPGDIGWVIARHGALYADEYGFDETFEAFVASIAAEFLRAHDPVREHCWIAERDGINVGSVFLVRADDETAKLRMLIAEPSARGFGLGRRLVDTCVAFARAAGYRRVTLWTHDILHAARHVYRAAGFRCVNAVPNREFGRDLVSEDWLLELA